MSAFKHVLVATDLSDASTPAIDLAVSIARQGGAALTLVHACELPVFPEGLPPVDYVTPLTTAAGRRLDELLAGLRDRCPDAKRVLKVGAPWEEILAAAAEVGADLVVVGTHGRRGLVHAMLGSVAERVVRLSPIPVLTVRGRPAR
jgi:nucleotide-binding universal stress UspA family protein